MFILPLQVEITLQDVNDNPPVFPNDILDVTIEENVGDGFKIMQLTATDADKVMAPTVSALTLSVSVPVFHSTALRTDILGVIELKIDSKFLFLQCRNHDGFKWDSEANELSIIK